MRSRQSLDEGILLADALDIVGLFTDSVTPGCKDNNYRGEDSYCR